MKNLRNLLAIVTFMTVLIISVSTARAGILMTDLKGGGTQSCTETNKTDWGIIVQGFTGIIVQGAVDTPTNCGIIVQD